MIAIKLTSAKLIYHCAKFCYSPDMSRIPEQIRLKNLELLIIEAGSAAGLAQQVGTNSSYLSQVRRQMRTKNGTPRGIGDDLAGKLEQGMSKYTGWMDEPHQNEWGQYITGDHEANPQLGSELRSLHPVITWAQARDWTGKADDRTAQYGDELLPCPIECSQNTYILRVHGISMEPRFHDGDLIFVDPDINPLGGKYVVVVLGDAEEATFKQLIIEGGQQYLKALNPEWPNRIIEVDEDARICGVVVFKGEMV